MTINSNRRVAALSIAAIAIATLVIAYQGLQQARAQQRPVSAQERDQVTAAPGSPGAATTINGEQLPPPPAPFRGKIERNAADSTPYWPARVVPPKGAPNVLLIITDDTGFGVSSTFGGVIPTP